MTSLIASGDGRSGGAQRAVRAHRIVMTSLIASGAS
jgi:hypothetical protein